MEIDSNKLDLMLEKGERFLVTYVYPTIAEDGMTDTYAIRTDPLLAVETTNDRIFVSYRGEIPVWLEWHEILQIRQQ